MARGAITPIEITAGAASSFTTASYAVIDTSTGAYLDMSEITGERVLFVALMSEETTKAITLTFKEGTDYTNVSKGDLDVNIANSAGDLTTAAAGSNASIVFVGGIETARHKNSSNGYVKIDLTTSAGDSLVRGVAAIVLP